MRDKKQDDLIKMINKKIDSLKQKTASSRSESKLAKVANETQQHESSSGALKQVKEQQE